jgi:hypothetical protein
MLQFSKRRSICHWTPRYIINRLILMAYERNNPNSPWLTNSMVDLLDTWLCSTDVGLEFGSGRSTIWFAKQVKHLISVEHDPEWYAKVNKQLHMLREPISERVDYHLLEVEKAKPETSEYVKVLEEVKNESLDFCLVDGMARDYCALASIDKLKSGGILIIDNVNWYWPREQKSYSPNSRGMSDGFASPVWQECANRLKYWRYVWTSNGVTDTAFWVKP